MSDIRPGEMGQREQRWHVRCVRCRREERATEQKREMAERVLRSLGWSVWGTHWICGECKAPEQNAE